MMETWQEWRIWDANGCHVFHSQDVLWGNFWFMMWRELHSQWWAMVRPSIPSRGSTRDHDHDSMNHLGTILCWIIPSLSHSMNHPIPISSYEILVGWKPFPNPMVLWLESPVN
jgi:hypothetical protein